MSPAIPSAKMEPSLWVVIVALTRAFGPGCRERTLAFWLNPDEVSRSDARFPARVCASPAVFACATESPGAAIVIWV